MSSMSEISSSLQHLQYPAVDQLQCAVTAGVSSASFRQLVCWLVQQLHRHGAVEETIITSSSNTEHQHDDFMMELAGVLRELQCAHYGVMDGCSLTLCRPEDRLILVEFLCGELMAARIISTEENITKTSDAIQHPADVLKSTLISLQIPRPPDTVTICQLFDKLCQRVPAGLPSPLWHHQPDSDQWRQIAELHRTLHEEYVLRRRLLLTRLDVTMQSFRWSPTADKIQDQLAEVFVGRRAGLSCQPSHHLCGVAGVVSLMTAGEQTAVDERLCSVRLRANTCTPLNKLIIGPVPDRGGRPSQQAPPPPEMPTWKPRQTPAPGTGGRGRGRGGRVQGASWNRPSNNKNHRRY